ncbi:hypothetical protein Q7P37_011080 [Cladosporium fusiforme]
MKNPWRRTPTIESVNLSKAAGCRVFLKLENLQPSGSFKSRGVGNYISHKYTSATNPEAVHFYCSSGGNAGLAAVLAAHHVGRKCTVVVPSIINADMIQKVRNLGADDVIVHGATWKHADAYLRETVMEEGRRRGQEPIYVPPFDHELIWDGHSTMVDEIFEDMALEDEQLTPSAIICSCGGGGLFNGIVRGLRSHPERKTTVVVTETAGADSLGQSLANGQHTTLPGITSEATSLGAVRVCEETFNLAIEGTQNGSVKNAVLSDAAAAMGCWQLADQENILTELSCGVNIAMCYDGRLEATLGRKLRPEDTIVIVVCGGRNVTLEKLVAYRSKYGSQLDAAP